MLSHRIVRWWRTSSVTEILGVGMLAIGLVSSAVWLARDLGFRASVSREATLRVNINTASLDELETLPGIGPALAGLIFSARPFASVDELQRVKGIGPATVESLRPYVKVSGQTEEIRRP
ncbi:MAG: ComEA family DNA-binding protein [Gammaproteobacteria bacterium]